MLSLTYTVTRDNVNFKDGHAVPWAGFRSTFQQNLRKKKKKSYQQSRTEESQQHYISTHQCHVMSCPIYIISQYHHIVA